MKLRFNREELAEALGAICGVASGRTPKEILKCVHVEARADVVLLSATDNEIGLRTAVVQVEVDEPGEMLVTADTFSKIVHECSDEILIAETDGSVLNLRGVGSHFKIVTHAAADFPAVPELEGDPDFVIPYGELAGLVDWTVFACAKESTRYAINGVLWEVTPKQLTMAATDGRRLSVGKVKLKNRDAKGESQAIVPGKALQLFARLPGDAEAQVAVQITSNRILLKMGRSTLSSNLIEGHFPKYQDVVPQDCDRVVQLNTLEFQGKLRQAALLTNEESKGVRLSFTEDELTITSRAPEQGEATISLPIEYKGEATAIGFNPVFLMDVLRVADTEKISFAFREANRPGLIKKDEDFLHVVMPVNLTSA